MAAALPGADPLAASLADGERPSPELVAGAQAEDALRPAAAWAMLAAALVSIWIGLNVGVGQRLVSRVALGKPPDVLVDHAREVLRTAGYPQAPADSAHGFGYEGSLLAWVRDSTAGWPDWDAVRRARPQVDRFWYRQSGYPLVQVGSSSAGVTFRDPPSTVPGMMRLAMDPRGRLSLLEVVAPVVPGAAAKGKIVP